MDDQKKEEARRTVKRGFNIFTNWLDRFSDPDNGKSLVPLIIAIVSLCLCAGLWPLTLLAGILCIVIWFKGHGKGTIKAEKVVIVIAVFAVIISLYMPFYTPGNKASNTNSNTNVTEVTTNTESEEKTDGKLTFDVENREWEDADGTVVLTVTMPDGSIKQYSGKPGERYTLDVEHGNYSFSADVKDSTSGCTYKCTVTPATYNFTGKEDKSISIKVDITESAANTNANMDSSSNTASESAGTAAAAGAATASSSSSSSNASNSSVSSSSSDTSATFIINTKSGVFHKGANGCSQSKKISDANKSEVTSTYNDLISQGYTPCGNCWK